MWKEQQRWACRQREYWVVGACLCGMVVEVCMGAGNPMGIPFPWESHGNPMGMGIKPMGMGIAYISRV